MYEVDLSGCGCCEGVALETPAPISNLPGLSAIAYRVGTYTQFKRSMQARLVDARRPGLNALKTRQDDDFTIALLDAWAVVCDILTFYQERIANESYKRTATERTSLLELARLVRYNVQPGVAANTFLAFTLDETPGAPGQAIIDVGAKAQSLPNPGEQPQVFETAEGIVARAMWNAMKPIPTMTQQIFQSTRDIWVSGTTTNLKRGDVVVIVEDATQGGSSGPLFLRVQRVDVDTVARQTHVFFEGYQESQPSAASLHSLASQRSTAPAVVADAFKQRQPLSDDLVHQLSGGGVSQTQLEALAIFQGWSVKDLFTAIAAQPAGSAPASPPAPEAAQATSSAPANQLSQQADENRFANPQVFALRQRASLFGHNAPDWRLMPQVVKDSYTGEKNTTVATWPYPPPDAASGKNQLDLDRVYSQITPGSWIAVESPGADPRVVQVSQAQETGASNYALSLKITHLELNGDIDQPPGFADLRKVTVYVQSEGLSQARTTKTLPVRMPPSRKPGRASSGIARPKVSTLPSPVPPTPSTHPAPRSFRAATCTTKSTPACAGPAIPPFLSFCSRIPRRYFAWRRASKSSRTKTRKRCCRASSKPCSPGSRLMRAPSVKRWC